MRLSHWIQCLLAVALLVVAATQAKIYFRQADIMRDQANIMRNQLDEMQAEQRPWVYAKGGPIPGGVTFGQDGSVQILINFNLINVGRTPAQYVSVSFTPYIGDVNRPNAREAVCHEAERFSIHGLTLFPGDDPMPWGIGKDIPKEEIDKATITPSPTQHNNFINPLIVLCVAYKSPAGKVFYHSPYGCFLRMATGPQAIFLDRGNVRSSDLRCPGYPAADISAAD
jgi:hypothetical protein